MKEALTQADKQRAELYIERFKKIAEKRQLTEKEARIVLACTLILGLSRDIQSPPK